MGSTTVVGFKKHANVWGSGLPVVVGAGDGLEIESESLVLDAQMIENMGLSGQGTQLPGALGNKLVSGDVVCPLYYRGPDLALAMALGTLVAPVQQGASTAYLHGLRMAASHVGLFGTLVSGGANHPVVREWPHVKWNGWTIECEQGQMAKLTLPAAAYNMHLCGADDDDLIVVSRGVSDRVLTIAASPASSALTVTVTDADDSVTELVITFVGTDAADAPLTEAYTLSTDTKSWTSDGTFKTLTSATMTGLTGTAAAADLVKVMAGATTVVADHAIWATTLTVAAQPEYSGPITVTVTDSNSSITELVILFSGTDEDGEFVTETYTLSTDTKTWTSDTRFATLTSAVMSGLAGASTGDTIKVGVANVNDTTSYASISLPSTADYQQITFAHLSVYINDQTGADFTDSDEVFVSKISLKGEPALKTDSVTTRFGNKIDEPKGDGFQKITFGLSFPQWDAANTPFIKTRLLAGKKKALLVFSGPEANGGYPLQLRFFLNNLQFTSGSPNVGGPNQIPLDLEAVAHRATANPTGLPAWANTQPLSACVVNLRSTAMWS